MAKARGIPPTPALMIGARNLTSGIGPSGANPAVRLVLLAAMSTDLKVRLDIARNLTTPKEVLVFLAKDDHYIVRCAVARNLITPVNVLVELASDHKHVVRREVSYNPNTPADIVR